MIDINIDNKPGGGVRVRLGHRSPKCWSNP